MIGGGCERDGLYYLEQHPTANTSAALHAAVSPHQWHCRLGHPSLQTLKLVFPSFKSMSTLECEACQLGKHHRVSFPLRQNNRRATPFELVHSDVLGPSRHKSMLGFSHFASFVDDCSRMSWMFLMKERSDISSIFQLFHKKVVTQFGCAIRTLQSDNALEYVKGPLQSYCDSQ